MFSFYSPMKQLYRSNAIVSTVCANAQLLQSVTFFAAQARAAQRRPYKLKTEKLKSNFSKTP